MLLHDMYMLIGFCVLMIVFGALVVNVPKKMLITTSFLNRLGKNHNNLLEFW